VVCKAESQGTAWFLVRVRVLSLAPPPSGIRLGYCKKIGRMHTHYNIVLLQAPTQCCYCKQRLDDPLLKVYPGDPDDAVSSVDIND